MPYQWRHSGPPIDVAYRSRSFEQVNKRGRVAGHEDRPALREALALGTELGGLARASSIAPSLLRRTAPGGVARRSTHGSSGTCWPSLKCHFVALIGSGTRQVGAEFRRQGVAARTWAGEDLISSSALRTFAHKKAGRLREAFGAPHESEEALKALLRLRPLQGSLIVECGPRGGNAQVAVVSP